MIKLKNFFSNILNKFLEYFFRTSLGNIVLQRVSNTIMDRKKSVNHNGIQLLFSTPNWLCEYRIETFSTKEPETLEWIESIPFGSVLWDIGANVGLYSSYAAKSRNCKVYAFEPSVFNLELLARNIFLNNLQNNITIIPLALNNVLEENLFQMTSTKWGGAISTFAAGYDYTGNALNNIFEYKWLGVSMDYAVETLKVPIPNYLKIDVDGIEHLILSGGTNILPQVQGILIEVNKDFSEQYNEVYNLLKQAGLSLIEQGNEQSKDIYNQIWVRN